MNRPQELQTIPWFIVALAVLAGVTSAILSWKMLGGQPHVPDELSYLFQGRLIASGRLWIPEPNIPAAFTTEWDHILRTSGIWRSMYPVGWPLLLAAGWIIHAPFLINPVILLLSTLGVFCLTGRLYDRKTAIIASIGFVASPFVLLQSAGFMSHPSVLLFAIWSLFYFERGRSKDVMKAAFCGTFAFIIRPYTAVFLLLPAVLWYFFSNNNKKEFIRELLWGAMPLIVFFCLYNYLLFGNIYKTGYAYDPDAKFRGSLRSHFLSHVPWYFSQLGKSLWGWPWPDLLIFLPLAIPRPGWKKDLVLLTCFLSLLCAYSVFYYNDIVYSGPRYIYEAVGLLAILAARAIVALPKRVANLLPLLFVIPLFLRLPDQVRYHAAGYHGQPHQLLDLIKQQGIGENALILIAGDPYVYRLFLLQNAVEPKQGSRVFANDIPALRDEIVRSYPRNETWILTIKLQFFEGVNIYDERSRIQQVQFERIR